MQLASALTPVAGSGAAKSISTSSGLGGVEIGGLAGAGVLVLAGAGTVGVRRRRHRAAD